jgi:hypothetical protein
MHIILPVTGDVRWNWINFFSGAIGFVECEGCNMRFIIGDK